MTTITLETTPASTVCLSQKPSLVKSDATPAMSASRAKIAATPVCLRYDLIDGVRRGPDR